MTQFVRVTLALLLSSCVWAQTSLASHKLEPIAKDFVSLLEKRDFSKATTYFDHAMKEALSSDQLNKIWLDLNIKAGNFEKQIEIKRENNKVFVTCKFEKGMLDLKVVFNDLNQISGFWIVPSKNTQKEDIYSTYKIYILALIISLIAGLLLYFIVRSGKEKKYYIIALINLPMCWLAFTYIRTPLFDLFISSKLISSTIIINLIYTLWGPITEEISKILFLIVPAFRRWITDYKKVIIIAFCAGIGFGIGEAWFVANIIIKTDPLTIQSNSLLGLSGYTLERLWVCIVHSVFCIISISGFLKGKKLLYLFYAILLHFLVNAPIFIQNNILINSKWFIGVAELILLVIAVPIILSILLRLSNLDEVKEPGIAYKLKTNIWNNMYGFLLPTKAVLAEDKIILKFYFFVVNIKYSSIKEIHRTKWYKDAFEPSMNFGCSNDMLIIRRYKDLSVNINMPEDESFLLKLEEMLVKSKVPGTA